MIKTLIFDLGKVLVPFELQRGYAALAPHSPYPPEELARRVAATDIVTRFEQGLLQPEEFFQQFSALLGLEVGYRRFCALWSSIFLPETLIPEDLLAGLRRNYRLLVLSNTNAIHFEMLRQRYPLLRHFDDFILSYRVGALKPAPEMYRSAIARAGCLPSECFYTDDIPSYVEAGRQHGLDAVQFCGLEQLEGELRARGIQWRVD